MKTILVDEERFDVLQELAAMPEPAWHLTMRALTALPDTLGALHWSDHAALRAVSDAAGQYLAESAKRARGPGDAP